MQAENFLPTSFDEAIQYLEYRKGLIKKDQIPTVLSALASRFVLTVLQ